MVECSESCEVLFEKLLEKLVNYKKIVPIIAGDAKMDYSWFVSTIVKKTSNEFLNFKKEEDCLDVFYGGNIGAKSQFSKLKNVFLMLLILSHGQAQVECDFSTNKLLLDVNMQNETLVAQWIVHDHMVSENMKPQDLQITKRFMELVKDAQKSYFLHLKEGGLKKLKTNAEEMREKVNEKIEDTNCQIKLLEETVAKLKADGDKYSFEAEKKASLVEIKATLLMPKLVYNAAI